jgi:hypothetical protein
LHIAAAENFLEQNDKLFHYDGNKGGTVMIKLRPLSGSCWLFAAISCALAGCAATGPASSMQPIATVQPTDRHLSCDELDSEMTSMDSIINAPINIGSNTTLASMAGTTALNFIPIVGPMATLAVSSGSAAGVSDGIQAQAARQSEAQQRKARLMQLYDSRRC